MKIPDDFTNIKNWGATGDGVSDDSAAFRKALEFENAKIYIPQGVYILSMPLHLPSGTHICSHGKAVMRLADGAGKNNGVSLLRNADYENGNSDIFIDGGTWDINSRKNPRGPEYDPDAYSGVGMTFIKVNGLQIRNITVKDPDAFFIRIGETEKFHFENIVFSVSLVRPNQDGIHIGGFCRNGVIRNIRGATPHTPNDDMIAINADDDITRHFNRGMKCGPIENIIVENINAVSAYTFVRLLSNGSPIKNILVRNISGLAEFYGINGDCWRFAKGNGVLENIIISNMNVSKLKDAKNTRPLIIINSKVRNFVLDNFSRNADGALSPSFKLDNNSLNEIMLEGLSPEQVEAVKLTENMSLKRFACDSKNSISVKTDKEFLLPHGSIEKLSLSSVF